jgi:hypothetical protein
MNQSNRGAIPPSGVGIEADQIVYGSGRISLEQLGSLAERLPWVTANVFIMPPHQYVVEAKLQSREERETFAALRYCCAHHPRHWKAFFRAYKTKGSYLDIGEYRYWYSQIGAARMINRSDRQSEMENLRGGKGERAVRNWCGCAYAWRREYGLGCENVHRYCNLLVYETAQGGAGPITRYAAMVPRDAVRDWCASRGGSPGGGGVEEEIRRVLQGVEAIAGLRPSYSQQAACSDEEASLGAVWMRQKDMAAPRVATDLRWFSTAPSLELERAFPLRTDRNYLVQLSVQPVDHST